MLKLSENPPILSPGVTSLDELPGPWWVAHTKARFEKALAWDLLNGNINYFLPMVERITVSSGKKRRGMMPLFPSYLFFCGPHDHRQKVLATNRVCQVIAVKEVDQFVSEITALQRALASDCILDFYPDLVVGRRVRVCAGALKGTEGTLVEKNSVHRLVLHISMLGQGASLEIAADLLEAVT